jgi:hypothetical protein
MPAAAERSDYLVKHLFVFPAIHLLKVINRRQR